MAWSIPALGDWPWDTSGAAMLERAVRITPLPGFGDLDALEVLEAAPGQCVFSSDDPHLVGGGLVGQRLPVPTARPVVGPRRSLGPPTAGGHGVSPGQESRSA